MASPFSCGRKRPPVCETREPEPAPRRQGRGNQPHKGNRAGQGQHQDELDPVAGPDRGGQAPKQRRKQARRTRTPACAFIMQCGQYHAMRAMPCGCRSEQAAAKRLRTGRTPARLSRETVPAAAHDERQGKPAAGRRTAKTAPQKREGRNPEPATKEDGSASRIQKNSYLSEIKQTRHGTIR